MWKAVEVSVDDYSPSEKWSWEIQMELQVEIKQLKKQLDEKDKRIEAVNNLLETWKAFVQEQNFCDKKHKDTDRIEALANALEKALRGDDANT